MAEAADGPFLWLGHDPEQARSVREHRVGDGQVRRQRERCVLLFGQQLRPEPQDVTAGLVVPDFLLGRVDALGTPRVSRPTEFGGEAR